MKKVLFICCLLVCGMAGFAQPPALYSLNFENRFVYNPARAGFNGNPELYLMYRKQWVDFNGAPETRAGSFDMGFKKGGFGLYIFNDIAGAFNTWGGNVSYAYHLNFKEDVHRLSIGLSAGINDYNFDREEAIESGANISDPLLQGDRGASFEGSAGVHYAFTKGNLLNLSVGFSALSIFATDLKFHNDASTVFIPDRTYLATISNRFRLFEDKFIVEPIFIMRFPEAFNYQIEPGVKLGYKDWVWLSAFYRYNYGVILAGGFKVHDAVKIGYAYDLALNDIQDYQNGTHEVMLGIIFGKKKDDETATKQEVEELRQKLMEQDSIYGEKMAEQDSLLGIIDEMNYQMEDMQYKVDSLENAIGSMEISLDDSTYAEMLKSGKVEGADVLAKEIQEMRKEMDDLKREKAELEKSVNITRTKVEQMEGEMPEERTRIVEDKDLTVKRGPPIGDYFMVVGSFRIEQNSYNFQEDLKKRGYDAGVVYDNKRKWYYVFIAQPKDLNKGLADLFKLREENPEFHDAWIHIMKKSMR